jgi:multidrug efflux system membrane fusion protein
VRLRTDIAHGAIVVPPSAIQRGPRGPYVFVINPDDTAKRQPVAVNYEDDSASIVASGLKAGETVVVDGASRLADGTKVTVAKPDGDAPASPDQPVAPGTNRQHAGG